MTTTASERFASSGIDSHIEWLGVGTKLMTLQITPLGTDCAQCLLVTLGIRDHHRLLQWRLIVDIERNEHIVVLQLLGHPRICPNGSLHLTTVHTAIASEVKEDWFAL